MKTRLFWKLGITYLVLPFIVLVAVDWYVVRMLRRETERAGFENLESLSRLASARLPATHDPAAVQDWISWLAASGARVTLVETGGHVIADSQHDPAAMENHSTRPEIQDAFTTGTGRSIRYSDTVLRDLLYLAVRPQLSPGIKAPYVVRLSSPLAQIDEAVFAMRTRLWGASLVILLLAGGGALLLSRRLSRRIERLQSFSQRVAQGDFRPLAVEHEGDELTGLGRALNETAARLDQTIRTLTAERNQSAAILRSMVEGVAVVDAAGGVVFFNDAFARAFGVTSASGERRPLVELVRQPELLNAVKLVRDGAPRAEGVLDLKSEAGAKTFAATAAPVRGEEGTAAVLVLHDITELRRLERVRRDFVANVSHEFKTPLTAIQGFAETLLGGDVDSEHRNKFLTIIRDHAMRLARITDDLLTLARIEAGKLDFEMRGVTVPDLIESCVETARFRAEQKRLVLAVECPAELPSVQGDARRLGEVLQNLLDNAVQYTPEGGSITLRASAARDVLRIAVIDTGIGIPLDEQERIFERFYRVDAGRSREAGGTGLGLSIARHLAEAHGGHIELESEVGRGSTFTLVLPANGTS